MSDLNSPQKSRSETSLAGSQPQSWSDVTLIEDITQEISSKPLPAIDLYEAFESSSESIGEEPHPAKPPSEPSPAQKVQGKRFRARSRSRGARPADRPCLRFNATRPCPWHRRTNSPIASVKRPTTQSRPACPRKPCLQETDPSLVSELHQEAQDAVGISAGSSETTQVSCRARMPLPPSKGGLQPRFFATQLRWSASLLGIAVPKPRPLVRPPPRSLTYKPPSPPQNDDSSLSAYLRWRTCRRASGPTRRASLDTLRRHPHREPQQQPLEASYLGHRKRTIGRRPAYSNGKRSCF